MNIYRNLSARSNTSFRGSSACAFQNTRNSQNTSDIYSFSQTSLQGKSSGVEQLFQRFLAKSGRMTKEEYDDINKNHPEIISKASEYIQRKYEGETSPAQIAEIAKSVDSYLKDEFGEYRIISVGMSPAALCETLSLMGNEVIFLPLSNCRNYSKWKDFDKNNAIYPDIKTNMDTAMEYLRYKGLKNDDKTNIVLDFTHKGTTLDTVFENVKQYNPHIPADKFVKMPLVTLIETAADYYDINNEKDTIMNFVRDLKFCAVEQISNTPHFDIIPKVDFGGYKKHSIIPDGKTKEEIFKEFDEYSDPLARAFSITAFHHLLK